MSEGDSRNDAAAESNEQRTRTNKPYVGLAVEIDNDRYLRTGAIRTDARWRINEIRTGKYRNEPSEVPEQSTSMYEPHMGFTARFEDSASPNRYLPNRAERMNDVRWEINRIRMRKRDAKRRGEELSCHFCCHQHKIFYCSLLRGMELEVREQLIRNRNMCINCLMPISQLKRHICKARSCRRCGPGKFHNSILCTRGYYK